MKVENVNSLLEVCLISLYAVEQKLVEALPAMAESASAPELKEGFEQHLEETKEHVARIEEVANILGVELMQKPNQAIEGLIADAEELMAMDMDPTLMDAALIGAAQKVEHFEIASYDDAIALASLAGLDEAVELLETTLEEEQDTSDRLLTVAEDAVHPAVADAFPMDDEEMADADGDVENDEDEEDNMGRTASSTSENSDDE